MNSRMKIFIMIIVLLLILIFFPMILPNVENIAISLGIRTFLILISIYLILELLKYLPKKNRKDEE